MQISLDPPIAALADATFELLRMQHWFDAILLIDDTAASDLFSYRLSRLCRRTRKKFTQSSPSSSSSLPPQSSTSSHPSQPQSSIKNSVHNDPGSFGASQHFSKTNYRKRFWRYHGTAQDYPVLDSVWRRLKIIQLSKNILQKEVSSRPQSIRSSRLLIPMS